MANPAFRRRELFVDIEDDACLHIAGHVVRRDDLIAERLDQFGIAGSKKDQRAGIRRSGGSGKRE